MATSKFILEYKFELAVNQTKALVAINALLFFILAFRGWGYLVSNPYTWFSLISGVTILLTYKIYNWRNSNLNLFLILLYVAFFICEFSLYGLPGSLMDPDPHNISKGILLDLGIGILPYLYSGLRIIAVTCLVPVWWYSKRLLHK